MDERTLINAADLTRWDLFTRHVIKDEKLYDWSAAILKDLDPIGSCVAVSAPNGSGKSSSVIANAVACHLLQYPRGRVICTSAQERQLTHVIMGYLRTKIHLFPNGTVFNQLEITIPYKDADGRERGRAEFISFTTNDAGKAEGWHGSDAEPLLIIIDEGKTVDDDIFSAFDRCTAQRRLVVSSPPTEASGEFYNIFHGRGSWPWKLHRITYFQCPHIEKQSPGKYQLMKAKYGEDHPIFRSMILGEFSHDSNLSVFNARYVDAAMFNPPEWNGDKKRVYAIDWSAGADEQVGGMLEGNRVSFPVLAHEHDTNKIVEIMADWLKKAGAKDGEVVADDGGLGKPMNMSLERLMGFRIIKFNGGLQAQNKIYYTNCVNEAWFEANDELRKGHLILPKDDILRHQLISRRKDTNGRNESRPVMETKQQMSTRGLGSPDRADVLTLLIRYGRPIIAPKSRIEQPKIVLSPLESSFMRECDALNKNRLDNYQIYDISKSEAGLYPVIGKY